MKIPNTGAGTNTYVNLVAGKEAADASSKEQKQPAEETVNKPSMDHNQPVQVAPAAVQPQAPVTPAVQPAPAQQPTVATVGQNKQSLLHVNTGTNKMSADQNNNQAPTQSDPFAGMGGANIRRRRTFSAGGTSENLAAAFDTLSKFAEEKAPDEYGQLWTLLPLPGDQYRLSYSSILYVRMYQVGVEKFAAVFGLMLESTGVGPLKPLVERDQYTGEYIEVPRMAGTMYDDLQWVAVQRALDVKYPSHKPDDKIIAVDAGLAVVHDTMDWTNPSALSALMRQAENAAMDIINRHTGYQAEPPFDITKDIAPDDRFSISYNFNTANQALVTADGLPVRNDVEISLSCMMGGEGQAAMNSTILSVNGFVEPLYAPEQQNPNMFMVNPHMMQQPMTNRQFISRFVMTAVRSGAINAESPELQLLSVLCGYSIARNNTYINAYAPRPAKGIDIRDIGALNLDVGMGKEKPTDVPKPLNTHDAAFTTEALYQFVSAAFRPEVLVAIDVEEAGMSTWNNVMFLVAAGSPDQTTAHLSEEGKAAWNSIVNAANNVTGGNFRKLMENPTPEMMQQGIQFTTSDLITVRTNEQVPGGYYNDDNNQRADGRNIDLLAVMNMVGVTDPRMVTDWKIVTNGAANMSPSKRIVIRNGIIKKLTESFVQKTVFERITFSHRFLTFFDYVCRKSGLNIMTESASTQTNPLAYGSPLAQFGINTMNPIGGSFTGMVYNNPQGVPTQHTFRGPSFGHNNNGGIY